MDRIARRMDQRARAQRQLSRRDFINRIEAMASVGRVPTEREYVTYHCYHFVAGKVPLSYDQWVTSLGVSHGAGMDGGLH
ncbi:MAG: hypothetical protein GWN93_05900 [Deltaproteobacteria bacterium]|nr:hypothetical protein [Deltaproteobacteria bacterium]